MEKSQTSSLDNPDLIIEKIGKVGDLKDLDPSFFCSDLTPVGWIEQFLEVSHVMINEISTSPWIVTIIVETIMCKVLILPALVLIEKSRGTIVKFIPRIDAIEENGLVASASGDKEARHQEVLKAVKVLEEVKFPFHSILISCIPHVLFISSAWALNKMAAFPVPGFSDGGILWFTDLTLPDPFSVLPFLSVLSYLFYCQTKENIGITATGQFFTKLLSLPAYGILLYLPAAVTVYNLTTAILSCALVFLFRIPKVKAYLNQPAKTSILKLKSPAFKPSLVHSKPITQSNKSLRGKYKRNVNKLG